MEKNDRNSNKLSLGNRISRERKSEKIEYEIQLTLKKNPTITDKSSTQFPLQLKAEAAAPIEGIAKMLPLSNCKEYWAKASPPSATDPVRVAAFNLDFITRAILSFFLFCFNF